MKPLGMSLMMGAGPILRVTHPSPTEDKIWEAVEAAIEAGWTPERFRQESAEGWADYRRRQAEDESKVLR